MKRGRVVPEDALAWSSGLLPASQYFAMARRRALASALVAVRNGLRFGGQAGSRSGRPSTS